jgi:hypothetical protein
MKSGIRAGLSWMISRFWKARAPISRRFMIGNNDFGVGATLEASPTSSWQYLSYVDVLFMIICLSTRRYTSSMSYEFWNTVLMSSSQMIDGSCYP